MRRLLVCLFPFFICGILIKAGFSLIIPGAVLTALFFICFIKKKPAIASFCLVFLAAGFIITSVRGHIFDVKYEKIKSMKSFEGFVFEKSDNLMEVINYKDNYRLQVSTYNITDIKPGEYIEFTGEVRPIPEYKKLAMNSNNINAVISTDINQIRAEKKFSLFTVPVKVKYKIVNGLVDIDKEGGSFIAGVVTGYTGNMPYDEKNDFKELGISHILAISGFNIGIIYIFINHILKNSNAKLRYFIIIISCFFYTYMGGFGPSILRAFLMILIAIFVKVLNRNYDIISGITLSSYIMLVFNPFYIYNPGFVLSYAAVYGIILFNNSISNSMPAVKENIKNDVSVCISAFLSTFPVVINLNGCISVISIFVNLFLSPLVVLITILGFISSLTYVIIGTGYVLYPVVFSGLIFIKIVSFFSKFNFLLVPGTPSKIFFLLYYLLLFMLFGYIKFNLPKNKIAAIKISLLIICIFTLIYRYPYLKVHIINVGQGDSFFIETPDRKCILIDTGPEFKDYSAVQYKIIPYIRRCGYNKIDALIITHFHNDHAGGLEYLFKNIKVVSAFAYKASDSKYDSFKEISKNNIIKYGKINFDILLPCKSNDETEDKNETCLIICLKYKDFSMLFTSDADREDMELLNGNYDILKVPHHGSINSFSPEVMNDLNFKCAIISVGRNNFGHPSDKVINEYIKRNIKVFRTDLDGDITVISTGKNFRLCFE
jgi:competence protein ComEC